LSGKLDEIRPTCFCSLHRLRNSFDENPRWRYKSTTVSRHLFQKANTCLRCHSRQETCGVRSLFLYVLIRGIAEIERDTKARISHECLIKSLTREDPWKLKTDATRLPPPMKHSRFINYSRVRRTPGQETTHPLRLGEEQRRT
jgi:hypothetical protein